jgi:hypothetical protein
LWPSEMASVLSSFWLVLSVLIGALRLCEAFQRHDDRLHLRPRQSAQLPPVVPPPSYNFSMPLDHFNASDNRTWNDVFYVNDTFYKPGGPVIYFDFGEGGLDDYGAARLLADWNGTVSPATQVARAVNGVIVTLGHRYYDASFPLPVNLTLPYPIGEPLNGAAAYRYLTVEQALEDMVYFAKHFDKLKLGPGNAVLGGTGCHGGTSGLSPDKTAWIYIGGSYPGLRSALSRIRSPEIWFAAWSSSGIVQADPGGSDYYNSVYRALSRNCTADVQAALFLADDILLGNDTEAQLDLRRRVALASLRAPDSGTLANLDQFATTRTTYNVASDLTPYTFQLFQNTGFRYGPQVTCDFMEHFNVGAYFNNVSRFSNDSLGYYSAFLYNPDDAEPPVGGIAAHWNASVALAAYLYAVAQSNQFADDTIVAKSLELFLLDPETQLYGGENEKSWFWQQLAELGDITYTNTTNPLRLTSALLDYATVRRAEEAMFMTIPPSAFPLAPNTTYVDSFGGRNMQPSNVMFTVGEFDPWRPETVFSLEQDNLGSPIRNATQQIPACGVPPPGTDVFGLVYGGAVHVEDMGYSPGAYRGSEGDLPVHIGSELFLKALQVWLPCFNAK